MGTVSGWVLSVADVGTVEQQEPKTLGLKGHHCGYHKDLGGSQG